ncbi:hypothetical protein F4780DRAFT_121543 [Xylariomycetidae sp. FL0641]|nr:hypothetical protein F4780DRAFT_121543 [Xylariomycetidae sp. FL0641]
MHPSATTASSPNSKVAGGRTSLGGDPASLVSFRSPKTCSRGCVRGDSGAPQTPFPASFRDGMRYLSVSAGILLYQVFGLTMSLLDARRFAALNHSVIVLGVAMRPRFDRYSRRSSRTDKRCLDADQGISTIPRLISNEYNPQLRSHLHCMQRSEESRSSVRCRSRRLPKRLDMSGYNHM